MTLVDNKVIDESKEQELQDIANRIRLHSIRSTNAANSGHPTSSCSAAEIMSVMFFNTMRYDPNFPKDPNSDRFVMSKGHACPALYAAWVETGHISEADLMTLRKIDSDIEGHPTPRLDFIDVGTGSLGQGLSCAAGMAYTGKYFDKASYRVYCLLGDGEIAEGSVWEALSFATNNKLNNLVVIVDINRLGQSEATPFGHQMDIYRKRFEAFGLETHVIDGHDIKEICSALKSAQNTFNKPTAILAKTFKGHGIPGIEDMDNWHGKPLGDKAQAALDHIAAKIRLPANQQASRPLAPIRDAPAVDIDPSKIRLSTAPAYKLGDKIATRLAYGTALVKLGEACPSVVALDCDVKNSTYSEKFKKCFPDRFIECYIAEQNMVGVAIGCAARQRTIPFCSTFATFFSRAFDQLRMGAISMANVKCCGSHAGCSIGEDGPSQMGLEDLAIFRTLPGCTVFYPSDAVSTERAVELAAKTFGICFIRTTRAATPVVYPNDAVFAVGCGKMIRQSTNDKILLIGAGITLFEALKAADALVSMGIHCAIMDPFTIKPLDEKLIIEQAQRVGGRVITVEDHYPEGGLGEAVCGALAHLPNIKVKRLAVTGLPRSGPPDALLEMFGISASHIIEAAKGMMK